MRILLTGAGGFLGSATAVELASRGHDVSGLGSTGRGGWPAMDLTDPEVALEAVAETGPEAVVHLAGQPSPEAAGSNPAGTFRANATTTWNLLEAVTRKAPAAIFVLGSSAAVYGRPESAIAGRVPESAPIEPVSVYGASKAAAEMIAAGYAAASMPRVATLRIFNLIGPGQRTGVAADLVAAAREGLDPFGAVRNPGAARDFTDVRDAARAIAMVAEARVPGVFNLCTGSTVPVSDLAQMVAGITGAGPGESGVVGAGADVLGGDPDRLREAVGWVAETPIGESIEAMLADRN